MCMLIILAGWCCNMRGGMYVCVCVCFCVSCRLVQQHEGGNVCVYVSM